jgi:hypothetical protein
MSVTAELGSRLLFSIASCRRRVEQRLRVLEVARVEPLGKPPVDRSEQFASLLRLALVAPEPRKARSSAEFPGLCLLLPGDLQALDERLLYLFGFAAPSSQKKVRLDP